MESPGLNIWKIEGLFIIIVLLANKCVRVVFTNIIDIFVGFVDDIFNV